MISLKSESFDLILWLFHVIAKLLQWCNKSYWFNGILYNFILYQNLDNFVLFSVSDALKWPIKVHISSKFPGGTASRPLPPHSRASHHLSFKFFLACSLFLLSAYMWQWWQLRHLWQLRQLYNLKDCYNFEIFDNYYNFAMTLTEVIFVTDTMVLYGQTTESGVRRVSLKDKRSIGNFVTWFI